MLVLGLWNQVVALAGPANLIFPKKFICSRASNGVRRAIVAGELEERKNQ